MIPILLSFYGNPHKHIGIVVSTIYYWEDVLRELPHLSKDEASLTVKVNLSELSSADFDEAGFYFYIGQAPTDVNIVTI